MSKSTGFEQQSGSVVDEVSESESGAAWAFEGDVDAFCWTGGAGVILDH